MAAKLTRAQKRRLKNIYQTAVLEDNRSVRRLVLLVETSYGNEAVYPRKEYDPIIDELTKLVSPSLLLKVSLE